MSLSFTEEQEELRSVVRRFVDEKCSPSRRRELVDAGVSEDNTVWSLMASQLGLQSVAVPDEYGGAGGGWVELGIVMEELGRGLVATPYFSTVAMAATTLITSRDEAAQSRWLPGIADGSITATLALADAGGWDLAAVSTTATRAGDAWTVRGTKHLVVGGATATLLLVVARTADGLGVFAVDGDGPGVDRQPIEHLDLTRSLATIGLRDAPARRVGANGDFEDWLSQVRDVVLAAVAAEQIGGAASCLDLAVDHARTREQFGRPIGSFQAIKHLCASLFLDVESGRSAVYHASAAVAESGVEVSIASAVAAAHCTRTFTAVAKSCIQVHGGIGYTWEHDAHLYLRRAKEMELLFGSPAGHRARIADLVGI